MAKIKIEWMETKTSSTGKEYVKATIKDEAGEAHDDGDRSKRQNTR